MKLAFRLSLLSLVCTLFLQLECRANFNDGKTDPRSEEYVQWYIDTLSQSYDVLKSTKTKYFREDVLKLFGSIDLPEGVISEENSYEYRGILKKWLYSRWVIYGYDEEWFKVANKAHRAAVDAVDLDDHAWFIENNMGHYYATRNDYDRAKRFYNMVIPTLKRQENYENLARLYTDLSNCFLWLEEVEESKKYLTLVEDLLDGKSSGKGYMAFVDKSLTHHFELKEYDEFLFFHELSKSAFKNTPLRRINTDQYYARYLMDINKDQLAIKYLRSAEDQLNSALSNEYRRELAKNDLLIAKCNLGLGQLNDASSYVSKGFSRLIPSFESEKQHLPTNSQLYNENTLWDLLLLRADIWKATYKLDPKVEYLDSIHLAFKLTITTNEQLKINMIISDSKYESISDQRSVINDAVDNLYELSTLGFDVSDKIESLLEISQNKIIDEYININTKRSCLSIAQKDKVNKWTDSILNCISDKANTSNNLDSLHANMLLLQDSVGSILELCEIDDSKEVNLSYLTYIESNSDLYLFTRYTNPNLIKLCKLDSLSLLMAQYHSEMKQHESIVKVIDILDQLSKILLPKIELPFTFSVQLDGMLSSFPYELLRKDSKYLIENHLVKYNSESSKEVYASKISSVLCVAPRYKGNQKNPKEVSRGMLYPLPFAQLELSAIKDLVKSKDVTWDSSRYNIVKSAKDKSIFHFAGHAIVKSDSAYLVSDVEQRKIITHEEIINTSGTAELVILSACESGLGEFKSGEGVISLGRSFIGSGAKSVVYSLWSVNDKTTTDIMKYFYENLINEEVTSKALRSAKLKFLKASSPEERHPYYWAAFKNVGDLKFTSASVFPSSYIVFSIMIVLVIIFLLKSKLQ